MITNFNLGEYSKLDSNTYGLEKRRLQIEILKLQEDVIKNKRKVCIVFEGRDTAGKSSAIKFFSEHLRPSHYRYISLGIPTKWESSHWFQRWQKTLPKEGEICFFDRSWYTRALTEPVMGYCSEKQYVSFMQKVIPWEINLKEKGFEIVKFYFSLTQDQQKKRMKARKSSELKYWKLSDNDERIVDKWDAFTLFKMQMFDKTSVEGSPWVVINSNNKMIARITALRYFITNMEYENKKLHKPLAWARKISHYSVKIEGIDFDNLDYEQFMILSKYSDDI
jgi:polyphosphate kinase 2